MYVLLFHPKEGYVYQLFALKEDRKVADIGSVAIAQVTGGIHHISSWAHVVTVHAIAGAASVDSLKDKGFARLSNRLEAYSRLFRSSSTADCRDELRYGDF